jgi:hypothetical protein
MKDPDCPQMVNTKDTGKALKDMTSALGNFFGFWKKFKGTSTITPPLPSHTHTHTHNYD